MKLPNVASLILLAAIVAALDFVASGMAQAYNAWWVPVLVLILGSLAKAGQVYLEQAKTAGEIRSAAERKQASVVRRTFLD